MHTLKAPLSHAEEIRKSRFIAHAAPVTDPEAAMHWLQQHSNPQATHNCWAYRIGQQYRFSDDGEPGGSAGKPILAAIDGQQLDQVVVLVIRYFGGIKLGVGGLMRAYGGVAARCLQQGAYQPLVEQVHLGFHLPFSLVAQVHGLLQLFSASKLKEKYDGDGVWLEIELEKQRQSELEARLRDLSRGHVLLQEL